MVGPAQPSARPSHPRVRAADVAAAAGVSISTVSLVVNGKWDGRVAPDTVARVRAHVSRLGYVVDESARRLATGGSGAVAVVAPAFTNPFYARVAMGAAAALGSAFQVVFSVPDDDDDPTVALQRLGGVRLDGALVAAPSQELLRLLAPELPTVLLDAPGAGDDRPRVDLDVVGGAGQLAEHLLALGHRSVALMDGTPRTDTFRMRREALEAALRSGGGQLVTVAGFESPVDVAAAHSVAVAALDAVLATGATAIVGATDLHAYGLLHALAAAGVPVPAAMSVAGFDDQPLSAYMTPSLTSVRFPADDLGRTAALLLADLLMPADAVGRHRPTDTVVLPVSLVTRASTGPAAAR